MLHLGQVQPSTLAVVIACEVGRQLALKRVTADLGRLVLKVKDRPELEAWVRPSNSPPFPRGFLEGSVEADMLVSVERRPALGARFGLSVEVRYDLRRCGLVALMQNLHGSRSILLTESLKVLSLGLSLA